MGIREADNFLRIQVYVKEIRFEEADKKSQCRRSEIFQWSQSIQFFDISNKSISPFSKRYRCIKDLL